MNLFTTLLAAAMDRNTHLVVPHDQPQPETAITQPLPVAAGRGNRITLDCSNIIFASPSEKLLAKGLRNGKYRYEFDGLYKRCCRCHDYWPADSEFFYASKNEPDGLFGFCKACYLDRRYPAGRDSSKDKIGALQPAV